MITADSILYAATLAIAFVVWLIRLEGRVNQTNKDNASLEKRVDDQVKTHNQFESRIAEELTRVRESLARIEGRLSHTKE